MANQNYLQPERDRRPNLRQAGDCRVASGIEET